MRGDGDKECLEVSRLLDGGKVKESLSEPDRAVFMFWLMEVKVTKDCDDAVWRFKSMVGFFRQWASTAFRFSIASLLAIVLAL